MTSDRDIQQTIDFEIGRYSLPLNELQDLDNAATEHQRYVRRSALGVREMAYPARRGGERGLSNSWTATEGRPQGARVLRVDQTLRFLQYSIPRPSSRPPHYLPFNTGAVRASLLTNEPTTVVIRRPSVVTGNTVSTATASSGRLHFVYPRNHPYRRYVTRALNHGRSTFSGRSTTQAIDANSVAGLGGRGCTSEQSLDDLRITSDPTTQIADENEAIVHQGKKSYSSLTNRSQSQISEHNNTPCNVEGQPGSSSTANQKPQKSFTLVRDEYGQLRRVKRLPDGTLFIKKRPPGYLISEQGGISSKSGPGAELQRAQSEVGTVLNAQSTAGTHGKKTGKKVDQRRRSEEFSTSCNRCTSASEQNELHQSRILQNSDPVTQTRRKNRRKDVLYRNDDNETEVNVTLPDDLVPRRRRQRSPKLLSRLKVVSHTSIRERQGPAHGSREELLECHDDDSIVDVVTVDAAVDEAIKELIALVRPPAFVDTKEQPVPQGHKKLGRPFKKFRGRFAKEKQAIRDAKRAEKVAIEQRELPGLDLLLKAIEDSTLELPIEFVDSSVIHDTNLLHEVGEVLKELVAEVSLEELRPKTSRSRRCWDHLPGRVRSKRLEHRHLNVPFPKRCLCNDDPRYAGFSPMPYMGQCSIESSDLSGIAIGGNVRKRRRKVEPSSPTCDQCTVSTRKRKVMRLEAEQDCTLKLIPAYGTNVALPELWRRMNCVDSEGRFGVVANTCRLTRVVESSLHRLPRRCRPAIRVRRRAGHLISVFNLTATMPKDPIVLLEPDMMSPLHLALPAFEGTLASAFMQYEAGVKSILDQLQCTKSVVEGIRSSSHRTLHFPVDVQLYLLGIQYEIWEYLTRYVQLGIFSVYHCSRWEAHYNLFEARMHSLLHEMNMAVALSSQTEMYSSYIQRFEEWNRKTNHFSTIYNNVYGLALSSIKHITNPNAPSRLQSMTRWNSERRPSESSEKVFFVDSTPFFEVGTCPLANADFDMENMVFDARASECASLENLLNGNVARGSSARGFSFVFPSFAVLALCRNKIHKEISYCNDYLEDWRVTTIIIYRSYRH